MSRPHDIACIPHVTSSSIAYRHNAGHGGHYKDRTELPRFVKR